MADQPEPLGVLIGTLPYAVGYTITDRHVVMATFGTDGHLGPVACADWSEGEDAQRTSMAIAEDLAAVLGRVIRGTEYRTVVVIGYGDDGPARTAALADALLGTLDIPEPIQAHVDGTAYRVLSPAGWSPSASVPDVSAEAVLSGTPPPATSRDELLDRYAPLETPLFGELEQAKVKALEASPPSLRAEVAQRTLALLAGAGDDDPQQAATLTYLATDPTALDQIAFSAAQDASYLEALVRTFRAAPDQGRPSLAAAAAAGTWLAGDSTPHVEALSRYAAVDEAAAGRRMVALVEVGMRESLDPTLVMKAWASELPEHIARADRRWEAERILGMPPDLAARLLERSQQLDDPPSAGHAPPAAPEPDPPTPTIDGPHVT